MEKRPPLGHTAVIAIARTRQSAVRSRLHDTGFVFCFLPLSTVNSLVDSFLFNFPHVSFFVRWLASKSSRMKYFPASFPRVQHAASPYPRNSLCRFLPTISVFFPMRLPSHCWIRVRGHGLRIPLFYFPCIVCSSRGKYFSKNVGGRSHLQRYRDAAAPSARVSEDLHELRPGLGLG